MARGLGLGRLVRGLRVGCGCAARLGGGLCVRGWLRLLGASGDCFLERFDSFGIGTFSGGDVAEHERDFALLGRFGEEAGGDEVGVVVGSVLFAFAEDTVGLPVS